MKKKYKVLFAAIIFVAGIILIFGCYVWFFAKQQRVALGLAHPKFPYHDYSADELNILFPQYANEAIKTTQTPEETHAKFILALKAGDINEAVECCFRRGDWDDMKEALDGIKNMGMLTQMASDLDTEITIGEGQNIENASNATFYYSAVVDGQQVGSTIDFIKDIRGVWLITSL